MTGGGGVSSPAELQAMHAKHAAIQKVECPRCGAGPGERCVLPSGQRVYPHQARRWLASDRAARDGKP